MRVLVSRLFRRPYTIVTSIIIVASIETNIAHRTNTNIQIQARGKDRLKKRVKGCLVSKGWEDEGDKNNNIIGEHSLWRKGEKRE